MLLPQVDVKTPNRNLWSRGSILRANSVPRVETTDQLRLLKNVASFVHARIIKGLRWGPLQQNFANPSTPYINARYLAFWRLYAYCNNRQR